MAIIKQLETKYGTNVSYHRVTAFNISYSQKKVVICIASYITKEARSKMNDPIEEIDIEIPSDDYIQFIGANPIEQSYEWLKQNVIGFEDSLDDFDVIEPIISESESEVIE